MERALLGIASVFVIGISAQWLAWRLRIPSILLLLLAGFIAGPVTGWLDPDALFGELLFPTVSLAVAIILFEGGLNLDIRRLRAIGPVVRNLLVIGSPITWLVSAALAYILLDFPIPLAALLGAILVVTGPTVVIPLLRQVHASRRMSDIVKWEGIVSDPIGAILAVLVLDFILATGVHEGIAGGGSAIALAVIGVTTAIVLGLAGAGLIVLALRRYWVPDFLRSHVTLVAVLVVFAASNRVLAESGLLAVTVMGSALASQRVVRVRRIVQFKENLRVLLISALFVVVAARLPLHDPVYTDPRSLGFLVALILVQRPLAVAIATWRLDLTVQERVFLAFLAPRGIVAAAIGSVFAIELADVGYPGAERLAPIVFLIIIGTVTVYGLVASPLARKLGVAVANPQGVLFVGAAPWVRHVAATLQGLGIPVLLADANWQNVTAARKAGLPAHYGNILDEDAIDELDLDEIGRCILATPNAEVNALAADHLRKVFDLSDIYQVVPDERPTRGDLSNVPSHLQARLLSSKDASWSTLAAAFESGYVVKQTNITDEFTFESFERHYEGKAIPLIAITERGVVRILDAERKWPRRGVNTLISLAPAGGGGQRGKDVS
ncbi:MAG: sodium:proton antiporter [Gemmatimonadetes bacterium]|nr:sodium:proton antiporter [Gemmatimonadota bacterium]